jgi:hypothetical protein
VFGGKDTLCFPHHLDGPTFEKNSPFVTDSIQFRIKPQNNIHFQYIVIDGPKAYEQYLEKTGLVTDPNNPRSLIFSKHVLGVPLNPPPANRVYLICIATFNIFELSRKADLFKPEFLDGFSSTGGRDSVAFHDRFGYGTLKSVIYGGKAAIFRTYDYSASPYSLAEIRSALLEYGQSIFNVSGIQPISSQTLEIVNSYRAFEQHGASIDIPGLLPSATSPGGSFNDSTATPWLTDIRDLLKDPHNMPIGHSLTFETH